MNNASINTANGIINWQSSRTREWIAGENTYLDLTDDLYKITGTSSGNAVNGNDFTTNIIDPLYVDLGCIYSCVTTSGTVQVSPNSYRDRIINYGDSICDCEVDVIIEGTTYPILIGN